MAGKSALEDAFLILWRSSCKAHGIEPVEPEAEYVFCPGRRWRFDFAWPAQRVAVEVEGGVWSGGRHTRPAGFEGDCEKYNTAAALGWSVLRLTGKQIKGRGTDCFGWILDAMNNKNEVSK